MNNQMNRTLTILADGEPVTGYARARVIGTERMGLYPSLFMLHLWNVAEEDYLALSRSREVTVIHEDVVLVSGTVSDVFRSRGKSGTEAHVAIAPGLKLWEAAVSLDVEAGVTVSETVRRLLEASGTGITLLSFPREDPVVSRGEAFYGRAAECIEEAIRRNPPQRNGGDDHSAPPEGVTGVIVPLFRCYLVPSGLCVIPAKGVPVSMVLTEEDLTDVPAFNCGGDMVLRTGPAGWTLGKGVEVRYGGTVNRGVISERLLSLDTGDGAWRVELIVQSGESLSE